jgi:hypothetical protein
MDITQARNARNPQGRQFVTGAVTKADTIVEAFRHRHDRRKSRIEIPRMPSVIIAGASLENSDIDVSWLAAASDSYQISADPRDYILTDIPIVTVDIPNRNMQGFPYEEVSYFDPLYGQLIYQTFSRKPTHQDHENKDPLKAKGVIFDSSLQYVPAYNVWKIRILAGWDRTKDHNLVNAILRKQRTGYSMGALVENFVPLVAGTRVVTEYGLLPIEAVKPGTVVGTANSPEHCDGAVFNGYLPVVDLSTESGQKISAALNHPILVLRSDLSTEWVEAGDLAVGDYVGVRVQPTDLWPKTLKFDFTPCSDEIDENGMLTCAVCGEKFRQLQRHIQCAHHLSSDQYKADFDRSVVNGSLAAQPKYPSEMTDELASLLGYFLSEGSWGPSGSLVGISGNDDKPDLLAHYRQCFETCFGQPPQMFDTCLGIEGFFRYLGVDQVTALRKSVPWSIMQSPRSAVISFLRAFWEGDGSARVAPGALSFCSGSSDLIADIQLLLLQIGIPSKLYEAWQCREINGRVYELKMHYANIFGASVDKFIELVGATSEARAADLRNLKARRNITQFGEELPFALESMDDLYARKHNGGAGHPYYRTEDGTVERLSLHRLDLKDNTMMAYGHFDRWPDLMQNVEKLDRALAERLRGLLQTRLLWTRVTAKNISHVLQPCYCLKNVGEGHNFIAEGVIVHNCSVCGAIDTNVKKCACMRKGKGAVIDGHLVYQQCVGVNFIENSSVDDPADITADTDSVWG